MNSDANQKVYRSSYVGKTRIWFFFIVFLMLDGLFLHFFAMIRFDDSQSTEIPIYFLPYDIFTLGWIVIGIILQFLIIYLGFIFKFIREPKYEIYPNNNTPENTVYHYFSIEQLVAFIESIESTLNPKPIRSKKQMKIQKVIKTLFSLTVIVAILGISAILIFFFELQGLIISSLLIFFTIIFFYAIREKEQKVFVLKNPVSKMFSFSLFGKKYLVLDPALLQIAQTQELRAFLVQNMLLVSTRVAIIRMVLSQAQYLWFVILIPIGYRFLREIFLYLIDLSRLDPNYFLATLFILVALIFTVIILRPIHLKVLRSSSSKVVFLTDTLAADVVGKRAMINMLVKQGQRWEIISVLVEEFRWLEQLEKGTLYSYEEYRLLELVQKFPLDQLNTELAKRMAPYIYMREKLRNLNNIYEVDIQEIEFTIQKAQERLQVKRRLYIEDVRKKYEEKQIERIPNDARLAFQTGLADWTQIDVNRDSILSENEIEHLIESVSKKRKKKDRKKLFAYEGQSSDFSGVEARILNIFQNVKEM